MTRGFQACADGIRPAIVSTKTERREVPPFRYCAACQGRSGLALGFGLLAFALGLSLAVRLDGLLAPHFRGRCRGRGLRGSSRCGGRLRCDLESRACECYQHEGCDQLFHLEPRLELCPLPRT